MSFISKDITSLHGKFWRNSRGKILRSNMDYSREPFRKRLVVDNIKGEVIPEHVSMDSIIAEILENYVCRSPINGDVFEYVQFPYIIPWMEAIIGCRIYSLGSGASMIAKPIDKEIKELPKHLSHILGDIESNTWFQKLSRGYEILAKTLGDKFPLAHTNVRGPGDMLGALIGHMKMVEMMLDPSTNGKLLKHMLDLCTSIWLQTIKMQYYYINRFQSGFCSHYGIWAPSHVAVFQEDIASLLSPELYYEYLIPCETRITESFKYSIFHMHSGAGLANYCWKEFCELSKICCLQIEIDPVRMKLAQLLNTMLEMNHIKPLIIRSCSPEAAEAIEEHVMQFPGSLLHTRFSAVL